MRLTFWIASGLTCWGLAVGCGGESSSKHDAGAGGTAESGAGGATLSSSIVDCLKGTLSQVRWSCAEDLMCASWAQFIM
jgi:hypothetical protein